MLLFTAIITLLSSNFVTSHVVNTFSPLPTTVLPATSQPVSTSSPSPTIPPITFQTVDAISTSPSTIPPTVPPSIPSTTISPTAEKELQKVIRFTQGLSVFLDFFNSTEPFGNQLKSLLEASRACGLVLYEGFSFENVQDTQEKANLNHVSDQLKSVFVSLRINTSIAGTMLRQPIYSIQENVIHRVEALINPFISIISTHPTMNNYDKEDIDYFKNTCQRNVVDYIIISAKSLLYYVNQLVVGDNYSDVVYESLYTIFYNSIKQAIAMLPMCHIIQYGTPELHYRQEFVRTTFEVVQALQSNFATINNERKEKYWSNANILNIVKKFILGDITVGTPYTEDNEKIAENIYDYLAENYQSFGYTYHVGVSNTGTNGNVDTLIQCSTDCKYIYGINNKDVYIIRNKRVSSYKECSFVNSTSTSNANFQCSDDRDSTDLTELAEQIQPECNPTAFSLVRSRLNYQSASDDGESVYVNNKFEKLPSGFSQKCIGDIYVVMAKNY